jgi:hypothetical protein
MAVERRGNVNWSRLLDNRKRDDLMIETCHFWVQLALGKDWLTGAV